VGKNDDLKTPVRDLHDFVDGLPAAKRILTVEGVVEHHNGILCSRIAFKMGKKKSESERRSVARAERVLEAGLVDGCLAVADVDRGIVDEQLIARGRDTTRIAVLRLGNRETGVEIGQITVDTTW
jgi:hypothetical protein